MLPRTSPQTIDEATEYLLEYLKKKYDEEFDVVEIIHEKTDKKTGIVYFEIDFTPSDNHSLVFLARVNSSVNPSPVDNYAQYYFKEDAEAICGDICTEKDYIVSFTVVLNGVPTSKEWTQDDSLENYMGEGTTWDPFNYVTVCLEDGLTDDCYAEQISDLMADLVLAPCGIRIEVQANNETIYWNNIYKDYRPGYDIETVMNDIASERRANELLSNNE